MAMYKINAHHTKKADPNGQLNILLSSVQRTTLIVGDGNLNKESEDGRRDTIKVFSRESQLHHGGHNRSWLYDDPDRPLVLFH